MTTPRPSPPFGLGPFSAPYPYHHAKPVDRNRGPLVVTDYLLMLRDHRDGKKVNKAATRRALLANLNLRSEASVEFKRCNVSAVLAKLGIAWLPGYRPAANYQRSLEKTVIELLRETPKPQPPIQS
jgi:hypothetical protein